MFDLKFLSLILSDLVSSLSIASIASCYQAIGNFPGHCFPWPQFGSCFQMLPPQCSHVVLIYVHGLHGSPWTHWVQLAWLKRIFEYFRWLQKVVNAVTSAIFDAARSWGGSLHNGFECLRLTSLPCLHNESEFCELSQCSCAALSRSVAGLGFAAWSSFRPLQALDRSAMKHLNFGWSRRCLCNLTLLLSQL